MRKLRPGDLCSVRYDRDNQWYPARVVSVNHDHWLVRWDPADPNIPSLYRVDDPEEDVR